MNFLEKNLETIIWENYNACAERGLCLKQHGTICESEILRLRQPALHPYGIADLVNIYYDAYKRQLAIQVIECKKAAIDLDTYKQAKRYESAYRHFLQDIIAHLEGTDGSVVFENVLVGASFDATNDLSFLYNSDANCSAYTYSYGVDGIIFTEVGKSWQRSIGNHSCAQDTDLNVRGHLHSVTQDHVEATIDYEKADLLEQQQLGNWRSPLLVTPTGVLLNSSLLNHGVDSPFADGE